MRFFYFYPYSSRPAGGLKQIRLQAQLLQSLGHDVFLVRDELFFKEPDRFDDQTFYDIAIPVWREPLSSALKGLRTSDALILPEFELNKTLSICFNTKSRIVVNNQNGFYAIRYAPTDREFQKRIDLVIANSSYNCTVSSFAYKVSMDQVFYVPHWVARNPFDPSDTPSFDSKEMGICYMPRKRSDLVHLIRNRVEALHPDVPWIEIDNLSEMQVAGLLRAYKMFFAAHHLEGCPLPALEAMACGCLVAGFKGTEQFTHPYATASNGYWAKNDFDVKSAVHQISTMIRDVKLDHEKTNEILKHSLLSLNSYCRSNVIEALSRFLKGLDAICTRGNRTSYLRQARGDNRPEEQFRLWDWFYALRKKMHYK